MAPELTVERRPGGHAAEERTGCQAHDRSQGPALTRNVYAAAVTAVTADRSSLHTGRPGVLLGAHWPTSLGSQWRPAPWPALLPINSPATGTGRSGILGLPKALGLAEVSCCLTWGHLCSRCQGTRHLWATSEHPGSPRKQPGPHGRAEAPRTPACPWGPGVMSFLQRGGARASAQNTCTPTVALRGKPVPSPGQY